MKYVCSGIKKLCLSRNRAKGYTLIEVIVATAIFSAMVLLAAMALNQGLRQYQGLMDKGVNFWEMARHFWINRSVASMTDYYVSDDTGKWFPYFRGTDDMISFVSLAPVAGDLPVVVWVNREIGPDGKYSLVYRELPVYSKNWRDLESDTILDGYKKGEPLVIMEGLDKLRFRYYGYYIAKQKEEWFDDFEGRKRSRLPTLIEITYEFQRKKGTLYFGIRAASGRKGTYNEVYQP
jgi:general secretion pathway protein J